MRNTYFFTMVVVFALSQCAQAAFLKETMTAIRHKVILDEYGYRPSKECLRFYYRNVDTENPPVPRPKVPKKISSCLWVYQDRVEEYSKKCTDFYWRHIYSSYPTQPTPKIPRDIMRCINQLRYRYPLKESMCVSGCQGAEKEAVSNVNRGSGSEEVDIQVQIHNSAEAERESYENKDAESGK